MSVIRYISDPHFSHKNMAKRRGFKDEFEMDDYMVEKWNSVVNKKDVTYILGDITMEKSFPYYNLDRLNGIKKVILGNHDQPQHVPELLSYVNKIMSHHLIKDPEYGTILLSHIPIHPKEFEYRIDFNMYGHVHENTYEDKRYINVCAEVIDYTPKLLSELLNDRKN